MVSGLCLTPRVPIQQFRQTSLNNEMYRVKPDSRSKAFPGCGHIKRSHPRLRSLSDFSNAGLRRMITSVWISTLFHSVPDHAGRQRLWVRVEVGNSHLVHCHNLFIISAIGNPWGRKMTA